MQYARGSDQTDDTGVVRAIHGGLCIGEAMGGSIS